MYSAQIGNDKRGSLHPLVRPIVDARLEQKISKSRLAVLSGISRRSIGLIEAGGDCTLKTLTRLYEVLGLAATVGKRRRPTLEDLQAERARAFGATSSENVDANGSG